MIFNTHYNLFIIKGIKRVSFQYNILSGKKKTMKENSIRIKLGGMLRAEKYQWAPPKMLCNLSCLSIKLVERLYSLVS